jgi:hypothetical protein
MIRDRMGPMRFPILDAAIELKYGTYWSVSRYSYPTNNAQFAALQSLIRGSAFVSEENPATQRLTHTPFPGASLDNVVLANAAQGKVTVIRGDWTLKDLGIEVLQKYHTINNARVAAVGKESKRMKAFARPFRIHARRDELRVLVVDSADHPELLDGASLINSDLVLEAIENLHYGENKYFDYRIVRDWLLDQKVFNGVLLGHLVNVMNGENLQCMGKGQYIRCDLGPGIDIVTTRDNLKSEIRGNKHAFIGIEPQGPKSAREDQQTVTNHWALCTPQDADVRLRNDSARNLKFVFDGKFQNSMSSLAALSYSTDGAFNETSFAVLMKWRVNNFQMHGGDYLDSPWLTNNIAQLWCKSLGDRTASWDNTLKINVPCALRAQIVTESLINLYIQHSNLGEPVQINRGGIRWYEPLKVAYVSDRDWSELVVESHGGCDLDDFFMLRYVTHDNKRRVIAHRSPNARGEYTIWDYVDDDWFPTYETDSGAVIAFPKTDLEEMPKQILEALIDGDTEYLALPSETETGFQIDGEMPYSNTACFESIEQVMSVEGGYGQYELAVRARNSVDPFSFDAYAIYSETAIDAFAQAGSAEDQRFILADRDRIMTNLVTTGAVVDPYISTRLGNNEIVSGVQGPIARVKAVAVSHIAAYKKSVERNIAELTEPWYVADLGNNTLYPKAVELLKYTRSAMYSMNNVVNGVSSGINEKANLDQNEILNNFIEAIDDDFTRHLFMMAFWHACWNVPTSAGKITDQPIFGTDLFDYLVQTLVYFGILHRPIVESHGHIERLDFMHFQGEGTFSSNCRGCGDYAEFGMKILERYWASDGYCRNCSKKD